MIALLLIPVLSGSVMAVDIVFKDGTWMKGARIYAPAGLSTGKPDARGVVLIFRNKLYIHHYPYRKPRVVQKQFTDTNDDGIYERVASSQALEHYAPPAPFSLDLSPSELGYSCTPSRIAFFHFDRPTLDRMFKVIERDPNVPQANKRAALQSITNARNFKANPRFYNTKAASARWQMEADGDVELYRDKVWYGKWFEKK